ncbi:MAG: L,D-transpeptidase family protein [Paucimonas sp.]|jgi:murein L,D-transpeptidase YafK|uniref:L,D-transpeptidase family protein n=1 Tax=Pantoea sp. Cy-639 TaxID=2608360 RepID=UPI0014229E46|nr:L,D-transpeptidase family protein [Pantoea sp. Cy-639]MDR2307266.1 L,D-transpeptidase family protein [Paucimonas sp.]NIF16236.1 L,D-transpeptidase family protein [Pantoea sp. Cy-639]
MRWLLALFCLSVASVSQAAFTETIIRKTPSASQVVVPQGPQIDKVLVLKSERRLQLISRGQPLKTYRISLGKQPKGAKEREGDKKTPEGLYSLDWRKVSDRYNLAMHISYPNITDAAKARREGVDAGSMIMIHGTPLNEEYPEWYFHTLDWTEGCIAMRNADMREVWSMVKDGTVIEIRP